MSSENERFSTGGWAGVPSNQEKQAQRGWFSSKVMRQGNPTVQAPRTEILNGNSYPTLNLELSNILHTIISASILEHAKGIRSKYLKIVFKM